jgi:hypothetical protein
LYFKDVKVVILFGTKKDVSLRSPCLTGGDQQQKPDDGGFLTAKCKK